MAAGDGYLAVPSLDEDFSLATLRDQLAFAATYPDEAFPVTVPGRNSSPR